MRATTKELEAKQKLRFAVAMKRTKKQAMARHEDKHLTDCNCSRH